MSSLDVYHMSFKTGMELTVKGIVSSTREVRSFSINVGHSKENIALHFNPRFLQGPDFRSIIMNSRVNGSWKTEEKDSNFPFEKGEKFEVSIVHNSDTFDIYLSNGNMVQFPNRLGDQKYDFIFFCGDAKIQAIIMEPSLKPTKR